MRAVQLPLDPKVETGHSSEFVHFFLHLVLGLFFRLPFQNSHGCLTFHETHLVGLDRTGRLCTMWIPENRVGLALVFTSDRHWLECCYACMHMCMMCLVCASV